VIVSEAQRRFKILQKFQELRRTMSNHRACRRLSQSQATLYRWEQRYLASGIAGLVPRYSNSGRRKKI